MVSSPLLIRAVLAVLVLTTCAQAQQSIAFRYNVDHVLFFISDRNDMHPSGLQPMADAAAPWVSMAGAIQSTPLKKLTSGSFDAGEHSVAIGEVYEITLSQDKRIEADVDRLVWQEGCGAVHAGALAKVRKEDQRAFQSAAAAGLDAFLAERRTAEALPIAGNVHSGLHSVKLAGEEETRLRAVLNRRMVSELQKLMDSPDTYDVYRGGPAEWRSMWNERDEALLEGKAKLTLRVQNLEFGAEGAKPRVLRALWTLDGQSAFFLFAIMKPGSSELYGVDTLRSAGMRGPEAVDERFGFDDMDVPVNVFGGDRLLLFNRGYESFSLDLFQIGPGKFKRLNISYGDGC